MFTLKLVQASAREGTQGAHFELRAKGVYCKLVLEGDVPPMAVGTDWVLQPAPKKEG